MKVTMLHVGTNTLFNISCKFIIVYYFTDFIKAAPIRGSSGRYIEHILLSRTKSRDIIGAHSRCSYSDRVTVYPYNGYIRCTNPIVRHVRSLA